MAILSKIFLPGLPERLATNYQFVRIEVIFDEILLGSEAVAEIFVGVY